LSHHLRIWGPAAVWAAVLFFLSAQSGLDVPPLFFQGEDKVVHAALYAVLGALLARGGRASASPPPPWVLVVLGVLYGASDEWHQSFVPGRDPSLGDWAADTVGLLLGYWITSRITAHLASAPGPRRPHETNPGPKSE